MAPRLVIAAITLIGILLLFAASLGFDRYVQRLTEKLRVKK